MIATEWHFFTDTKPEEDRPILVYWEEDSICFLEKEYNFLEGVLTDEDHNHVTFPDGATPIWAYWPILD